MFSTMMASSEYRIQRSLRFNDDDAAFLSRSVTAGNRKAMTFSLWFKRANLSSQIFMLSANRAAASEGFGVGFTTANALQVYNWNGGSFDFNYITNAVFRDPSAWYHLVIAVNTDSGTAADRVIIYLNGSRITSFSTATNPGAGALLFWNSTNGHAIGRSNYNTGFYFDGLIAEFNFVDGQTLPATAFGRFDALTGAWTPKKYAGTYGTNGFYLDFSDNSGTTSTTLGKDTSGNANNWTPTNFSVTTGIGNDSMTDTPTNNHSTWNSLDRNALTTLANGGLSAINGNPVASYNRAFGTIAVASGKWYAEFTSGTWSGFNRWGAVGVGTLEQLADGTGPGTSANEWVVYATNVSGSPATFLRHNLPSGGTVTGGFVPTDGKLYKLAVDMDAGKIWFGEESVWYNSGDPATGANPAFSNLAGKIVRLVTVLWRNDGSGEASPSFDLNAGQRPFAQTVPAGFRALNTVNLPTPVIKKPGQFMNVALWTGDGAVTKAITGLGFQPDLAWGKARSSAFSHILADSVRGAQLSLSTDTTGVEASGPRFSSFDPDGFTVGDAGGLVLNANGTTFVGFGWKEGVIPGFDVATFSTVASPTQTFAHSLGAVPHFFVVKRRDNLTNWFAYHRNMNASPQGGYLGLNTTAAFTSDTTLWNNTAPTSSLVTLGSAFNSTGNWLAYLWTEVSGFSRIGTYVGNGVGEGPFVWCGFRPAFVMAKIVTSTGNWVIHDKARNGFNADNDLLYANLPNVETDFNGIDLLSNGFKLRTTNGDYNGSGHTYVFAAFAEHPFKYGRAR